MHINLEQDKRHCALVAESYRHWYYVALWFTFICNRIGCSPLRAEVQSAPRFRRSFSCHLHVLLICTVEILQKHCFGTYTVGWYI